MEWLFIVPVVLLADYLYERILLRAELRKLGFTHRTGEEGASALELASIVYGRVKRGPDRHYLLPFLAPLGSTPLQVLRRGGCCSGLTRLYVLLLHELRIPACQITLYHRNGNGQHCLAEVATSAGRMVVDPSYGFWYGTVSGDPLGLDDLRFGERPTFFPLPGYDCDRYPANAYYDWIYHEAKTASWTHSVLRRAAYKFLYALSSGRIDTWRLRPWLEWPQLLLAVPIFIAVAVSLVLFAT
jgi:hypothetical protein